MSITGVPGEGPMRVGIPIADLCAGLFAAQGIMIALLEREQSGKGQWVQSSLLQSQVFHAGFPGGAVDSSIKEVAPQAGNNHPDQHSHRRLRDDSTGHINIASAGQAIYERFCKAVDAGHLITNPDYADGAVPLHEPRCALIAEINAIIKSRRIRRLGSTCSMRPACRAGRSTASIEVFADPQVKHLGAAESVHSPDRDEDIELVAQAIKLSRTRRASSRSGRRCAANTRMKSLRSSATRPNQIADFKSRTVI